MSTLSPAKFTRAKPLLGTLVEISVAGWDPETAHAAIDRGFTAVADVHRLMSFHEAASDVSRLNREAYSGEVTVDPRTWAVLAAAAEIAEKSSGVFDITVAPQLVAWGMLPRPDADDADPTATWRDIVLETSQRVRFRKRLWIDLGGIAKGYAVDAALTAMALPPDIQGVVNAGGDLRVCGPTAEPVRLRAALVTDAIPVVEIADGALASSSGCEGQRSFGADIVGPHVDTRTNVNGRRASMGATCFVAVAAPACMTADALTKVVLALGPDAQAILGHFGAIAYFYEARAGWITLRHT